MEPSQGIQQKIALTCKPNNVKKCNTVGFSFFNGKTGNIKPENLTMTWSRIILNNIIPKVPDFAFEKSRLL